MRPRFVREILGQAVSDVEDFLFQDRRVCGREGGDPLEGGGGQDLQDPLAVSIETTVRT